MSKQTVLITGCSTGIGKLAARTFHANGWNVAATMRRPERETELTALDGVLVTQLDRFALGHQSDSPRHHGLLPLMAEAFDFHFLTGLRVEIVGDQIPHRAELHPHRFPAVDALRYGGVRMPQSLRCFL